MCVCVGTCSHVGRHMLVYVGTNTPVYAHMWRPVDNFGYCPPVLFLFGLEANLPGLEAQKKSSCVWVSSSTIKSILRYAQLFHWGVRYRTHRACKASILQTELLPALTPQFQNSSWRADAPFIVHRTTLPASASCLKTGLCTSCYPISGFLWALGCLFIFYFGC